MNEFEFTDVYDGKHFGDRDNSVAYPDALTSHWRINFDTPGHSEEDVRMGIPMMGWIMDKTIALRLFDSDDKLLYEHNRMFSFFVNEDGVDPKPRWVRDGTQRMPYQVPRDTHLLPFNRYSLEVERTRGHSNYNPIGIIHQSADFNEELYGIAMPFGGVPGIWRPLKG